LQQLMTDYQPFQRLNRSWKRPAPLSARPKARWQVRGRGWMNSQQPNVVRELAEAERQYATADVAGAAADLQEGEFFSRMRASGVGPFTVQVVDAPHVAAKREADAAGLRAFRAVDVWRQQLAEFRDKHAADLRLSLV